MMNQGSWPRRGADRLAADDCVEECGAAEHGVSAGRASQDGVQATAWRVRDSLRVWPRGGVAADYVVEEPASRRFFRLGAREYRFLCRLEEGWRPAAAWSNAAGESDPARSQSQAAALLAWLQGEGLIHAAAAAPAGSTVVAADDGQPNIGWTCSGPWFAFRIGWGCNGDRPRVWETWLAPLFTRLGFALALAVVIAAAATVLARWPAFAAPWRVLAVGDWVWLLALGLATKMLHEMAHAAACRRFGGQVREVGALFLFGAPLAFVDVTPAWRIAARWKRMVIAAAGVYVEILLAALAALVWASAPNSAAGEVARLYGSVLFAASVLINLNPLMRLDGYYLLADGAGVDNLFSHSLESLRPVRGRAARRKTWWLPCYAVLAVVWRGVVWCGLGWAIAQWFAGWGNVLLLLAAGSWLAGRGTERTVRGAAGRDALGSTAVVAAAVALGWAAAHSGDSGSAEGVVRFRETIVIRSGSEGKIVHVAVADGAEVRRGDLLVRLENPALLRRLEDARWAVRQAELAAQRLSQAGEFAAAEAEQGKAAAWRAALRELQDRVEGLELRAPADGVTLAAGIEDRLGEHLRPGEPLAEIGAGGREVAVLVREGQYPQVRDGVAAVARVAGETPLVGRLQGIAAEATTTLSIPELGADCGGGTPVRLLSNGEVRLLTPCFEAVMPLPDESGRGWAPGRRVRVRWPADLPP